MSATLIVIIAIIAAVAPIPLSFVIEALRKRSDPPTTFAWAPSIPIQYLNLDGVRIRYIKTGDGAPLMLLHTLRTQLDIFQKVIPDLARDFTVFALDYPGHGWSDIPEVDYKPELFTRTVAAFMDQLNIRNIIVAGISIGGIIPLLLAAEHNSRIRGVVSINPYDYAGGNGLGRGNLVARIISTLAPIPVMGETVMRMRNNLVERIIFEGGVSTPSAITAPFLAEMVSVGNRPHHYRAFLNLLRHAKEWTHAHAVYGQINIPVLLVYGDQDWSNESERKTTYNEIPGAQLEIVPNGGHFLSLDRPESVIGHIKAFSKKLKAAAQQA
ncbi:MAG: alpha/beta fold hydrolase [Burkholderiales bacterium]